MSSETQGELPDWRAIIGRAITLRTMAREEETLITYDQLIGEELSIEQIAEMLVLFDELTTVAGTVKKAITAKMAEVMAAEERTSIEAAGVLVTWKPKKSTRVVDLDAYWDYMRKHPELLPAAFNPNDMRKTGIPQTVFDTFFEEVPGVSPVIGMAPMWIIEQIRNKKLRQTEGETSNG